MDVHNNGQLHLPIITDKQSNTDPIIGGPPIYELSFMDCRASSMKDELAVTGCTDKDYDTYKQVQKSIDCVIANEPSILNPGSLGYSVNLPTEQPFSCMVDLLQGQYSNCNVDIPDEKKKKAFDAFSEVTGYKPVNFNQIFDDINEEQQTVLIFTIYYIFVPLVILILISVWSMVIFGWFNWVVGIFITIFTIVLLYSTSIAYRVHLQNYINDRTDQLKSNAQNNFENTVAYLPQGLFAVACAITGTGTTGWTCNDTSSTINNSAPYDPEVKIPIKNSCVKCDHIRPGNVG